MYKKENLASLRRHTQIYLFWLVEFPLAFVFDVRKAKREYIHYRFDGGAICMCDRRETSRRKGVSPRDCFFSDGCLVSIWRNQDIIIFRKNCKENEWHLYVYKVELLYTLEKIRFLVKR